MKYIFNTLVLRELIKTGVTDLRLTDYIMVLVKKRFYLREKTSEV